MYKVENNTVRVPLEVLLSDNRYSGIKIEKRGLKYAYLNLEQYETLLSILQETKFKRGQRVFWFKNGSSRVPKDINSETVNTSRIDIITKIDFAFDKYNNLLDDSLRYSTKEVNGNRIGLAYESYLVLVDDFNLINGTSF
jgi:hypothetical protein